MKLRIEINIWVLLLALIVGLLMTARRSSKTSQAEAAVQRNVKTQESTRTRYNRVRDQETGGGFYHRRGENGSGQPRKTAEEQIEDLDKEVFQKSGLNKIFEGRYQVVEQQS